MLALHEVQHGVRLAVHGHARPEIIAAILGGDSEAEARLSIHRHNFLISLTEALKTNFPVVCRVVDERFFAFAADAFIRAHPPTAPCLAEYGAAFPDFLRAFKPARGLPYLGDLARLELAVVGAKNAPDAAPIDASTLRHVPITDYPCLTLRLDPSLRLLRTSWAVQKIWAAHQETGEPDLIDLGSDGARLIVRRREDGVEVESADRAIFAFVAVLRSGRPLIKAGAAALAADPFFDMAMTLRRFLAENAFVGFSVLPIPSKEEF